MTETEDGHKIGALVALWRDQAEDPNGGELQIIIRRWCVDATSHGVSTKRQLEMLAHYGIVIGGGGHGQHPGAPACEYCGASDSGGHGGLCPAGSTGVNGGPGGPGAGGGGGATVAPLPLPAKESQ